MNAVNESFKPNPQVKVNIPAPGDSIFANDSTFDLIRKFFVYKLMGSNLFINHALGMIHLSYKAFGLKLTNFAINNSVASIFTSGETIRSLTQDVEQHQKKNIGGIAGYIVEGLPAMDYEKINAFHEFMMQSIIAKTQGKSEGHFALKFTAIISIDVMTRLSRAQYSFINDILKYDKQEKIKISDLKNSLLERGINFSDKELTTLFESLKFESNKSDSVSRLELYANAHLFKLDPRERAINNGLMQRIAIGVGVGVTESDLQVFE